MKARSKKVMISIITSLVLVSSMSVIAPIIICYTNSYSKNSILLNTVNNYSSRKLSNYNHYNTINTLINNLTYINKYIKSTLIIKEKRLRLSILGGLYDKSATYKNDKKKKRSELARFSHRIKHVHRYGDQVQATIDNSTSSLGKESGVISQVITIINEHPYTYNYYLNKLKISIPDISFFLGQNNLSSSNNLNSKTSDISNSSYGISRSDTNLNSIAFYSEEDGVNAQTLYSGGSSVWKAAFKKITFQAQIITFNKTSNSFEYETPTAKENTTGKILTRTKLYSENKEISNANSLKINNPTYFNSNKTELSILNSLNNTFKQNLPTPLAPDYLPGNFNTQLVNAAEARVKYNHISSFKHNNSLYYSLIFSPVLIVGVSLGILSVITARYKYNKSIVKRDSSYNLDFSIDDLDEDINSTNLQTKRGEALTMYENDIVTKILAKKTEIANSPLSKSDRTRLIKKINNTITFYNSKTAAKKQELMNAPVQVAEHTDESPVSIPTVRPRNNSDVSNNGQNDITVQMQNQNKDNIEAEIDNYYASKTTLQGQINLINNQHDLDQFIQSQKTFLDGMLLQLNINDYVSKNEAARLKSKVQNILDEIFNRTKIRSNEISRLLKTAEQKALKEKKRVGKINSNRYKSDIEVKEAQIKNFTPSSLRTEKQLDETAIRMHTQIDQTIQGIHQDVYNQKDSINLLDKAYNLHTLLDHKVAKTRSILNENNKQSIQKEITEHLNKIDDLRKIIDREELLQKAQGLRTTAIPIKNLINYKLNNGKISDDLNAYWDTINPSIDEVVTETQNRIDLRIHLSDTKNWIDHAMIIVSKKLAAANTKGNLRSVESALNFVLSIEEKEITPIVKKARAESKKLGEESLKHYDTRIRWLRKKNHQVYESKKDDFIKSNDGLRALFLQKQEEWATCDNNIRKGKLPDGTKLNKDIRKNEKVKRDSLKIGIKELQSQLDKNEKLKIEINEFKFPEQLVNILDDV